VEEEEEEETEVKEEAVAEQRGMPK